MANSNSVSSTTNIAIISDTHNVLHKEVIESIQDTSYIIHAGDLCNDYILKQLSEIATVFAVKGNNDKAKFSKLLQDYIIVDISGKKLLVAHFANKNPPYLKQLEGFDLSNIDCIISGHTHKLEVTTISNKTLWINPGSAKLSYKKAATWVILSINNNLLSTKIYTLPAKF